VWSGRLASRLLPTMQLTSRLDPAAMSHDAAANQSWVDDALCHDTGTLEQLAGMLDRAADLDQGRVLLPTDDEWRQNGGKTDLAVRFFHGSDDPCVSFEAMQRFKERQEGRVKDIAALRYEGAFHCLSVEPEHKAKFTRDVIEFIEERSKSAPVQSKL